MTDFSQSHDGFFTDPQCLEDISTNNESVNELICNGGDGRTAPATPGLLNMKLVNMYKKGPNHFKNYIHNTHYITTYNSYTTHTTYTKYTFQNTQGILNITHTACTIRST